MTDKKWKPASEGKRSIKELFKVALATEHDSHEYWAAIHALQFRGGRDIFDAARQLLEDEVVIRRKVGVDVLSQLDFKKKRSSRFPFADETIRLFHQLIGREEHPNVLNSLLIGLAHLDDPDRFSIVNHFIDHPDDDIRFAVAFCCAHLDSDEAIETLIELSQDKVANVRDWATAGLGWSERDTPAIRAALWARIEDEDIGARFEAIEGLATRRDNRVIDHLVRFLAEDHHDVQDELCEALSELQQYFTGADEMLQRAIEKCRTDDD